MPLAENSGLPVLVGLKVRDFGEVERKFVVFPVVVRAAKPGCDAKFPFGSALGSQLTG